MSLWWQGLRSPNPRKHRGKPANSRSKYTPKIQEGSPAMRRSELRSKLNQQGEM